MSTTCGPAVPLSSGSVVLRLEPSKVKVIEPFVLILSCLPASPPAKSGDALLCCTAE
ncbi:MAG: hypothetical protein MUF65_13620 [Rubritepida sp.]|nr:hypothetical protein [Rubritepida sp.]